MDGGAALINVDQVVKTFPGDQTPVVDHVRAGVSTVRSEVVDRYHDVRDRTPPAGPGSTS